MKQGGGQRCPPLLYGDGTLSHAVGPIPARLRNVSLGHVLP